MHAYVPIYVPAKDENPDGCLLSSFLLNSENFAGVTSSPALAGENSRIPAPLSLISSSEESSKDIDTVGPSSASRSRRRRRARDGWKLNSWGCSSRPTLTKWQSLSWKFVIHTGYIYLYQNELGSKSVKIGKLLDEMVFKQQDLTFFKIWNSELTAFKHYSFKIRKLGDHDIPRLAESEW